MRGIPRDVVAARRRRIAAGLDPIEHGCCSAHTAMKVRAITRPRSAILLRLAVAACLALLALAGDAAANRGAQGRGAVRIIRPVGAGRIIVPGSRTAIREQRKAERFFRYRYGAKAYLKASGARPAPARYHAFVNRALRRAERTLNAGGLSIRDMEVLVLDDGAAEGLNAASWAGRLLTFNRDLIDMSFEIASAVQSADGDPVKVEKNLFKLAVWERSGGPKPSFKVANQARRNLMAEGIFMGVVLHEIGHSFMHSPRAVEEEPPLWTPGQVEIEDAAASRRQEREADKAGIQLALAGASPDPAAYTLFFKYMKVARGVSGARFPGVRIGDNQTHPSDNERIINTNRILRENGVDNPYEPEPGKIWTPSKQLVVPGVR